MWSMPQIKRRSAMEHIAVDLGGRKSQICRRNHIGEIIDQKKVDTNKIGTYLKKCSRARVIVETSAEAFSVAEEAKEMGHEIRVVPATLAPSLGVGARRTKTDERDAQALSEISCRIDLPSVHMPTKVSRERKALCTSRESLVYARTALINSVRGYLRTLRIQPCAGSTETFPKRVRKCMESNPAGLPIFVEKHLLVIEEMNKQIAELGLELTNIAEQDPVIKRLMTVPGVGPVTATRFVSAIDEFKRFPNASKVEAYLGITPGEKSSGARQRRTSITKAGPSQVRWALTQASHCALRTRPQDPMVMWAKKIEKRGGKPVAIVALARKMAGILWAIWRDGTVYNPNLGAKI
jgi:transposase